MGRAFRIGIAGLGTVGSGVIEVIQKNGDLLTARAGRRIEIVKVSAQSKKKRPVDISAYEWTDMPEVIADDKSLDAVVELMGGSEGAARSLVTRALKNGRHVVTANKALLAHHGHELAMLAEKNNASLMFEAAVAGGIPIIKALREGYAANRIEAVYGILNGTCNYILTQMRETGRSFGDVLTEAQDKGYAEADPTFDVDGIDAGHKLSILSAVAYGVKPEFKSMPLTGIRHLTATDIKFASELGYKIKLLGIARNYDGRIMQSVEPCLVPASSQIGAVENAFNAVYVVGDFSDKQLLTGRGAGAGPTASAVVADIVDLARGVKVPTFGVPAPNLYTMKVMDRGATKSRFYLRMTVLDRPGVIADIAAILRDQKISMESVLQHGRAPDLPVDLVMTTHEAIYEDMKESCRRITALDCTVSAPCLMPVVEL
ncbi:MAG: homoserine dehydrogenase [Alphaproteobacteria bacterium]